MNYMARLPEWHVVLNMLYVAAAVAEGHSSVVAVLGFNPTAFPYPCHDDLIPFWGAP